MKKRDREILSEKFVPCNRCSGSGQVWVDGFWGNGHQACRRCNGHGRVVLTLLEEERKVRD